MKTFQPTVANPVICLSLLVLPIFHLALATVSENRQVDANMNQGSLPDSL